MQVDRPDPLPTPLQSCKLPRIMFVRRLEMNNSDSLDNMKDVDLKAAIERYGQITWSFTSKKKALALVARVHRIFGKYGNLKSCDTWQNADGDWMVGTDTYG